MKGKGLIGLCMCLSVFGWADSELEQIDQEIQLLKKQQEQHEYEELKNTTESQDYFIADWEAYSKEIQEARKEELEAVKLKKRIEALEQRKRQLLNQSSEHLQ
jgi:type IV secretory pathway VirJ component